jgi:hypothetical protein
VKPPEGNSVQQQLGIAAEPEHHGISGSIAAVGSKRRPHSGPENEEVDVLPGEGSSTPGRSAADELGQSFGGWTLRLE